MDVLTAMVRRLRIEGQLYGRLEFTAPWALAFPGDKGICLMVTRGSCFLGVDDQPRVPLVGGDFIFLPAPHSYSLSSSPEMRVQSVRTVISEQEFRQRRLLAHGGDGLPASVIAGCFRFATPESAWLIKHLPMMLRVSAAGAPSPLWFQSTLQFLEEELRQDLPGASHVVDRLADALFVHALRACIQSPLLAGTPNWLCGLADPQVATVLHQMYAEPERRWTVPELARVASMSRSAFASRFLALVGTTPMHHLTQWRMMRAATLLREERLLTLASVADAVGYDSASSFGKVFRQVVGMAPGTYRRLHD